MNPFTKPPPTVGFECRRLSSGWYALYLNGKRRGSIMKNEFYSRRWDLTIDGGHAAAVATKADALNVARRRLLP